MPAPPGRHFVILATVLSALGAGRRMATAGQEARISGANPAAGAQALLMLLLWPDDRPEEAVLQAEAMRKPHPRSLLALVAEEAIAAQVAVSEQAR